MRKGIFASHLQEVGNAGIEIIPENEARSGEDHVIEMEDGARKESGIAENEERLPEKIGSVFDQ